MTCNKKSVCTYIYTRMCVFFDMYKLLEIIMKLFSQKHVSWNSLVPGSGCLFMRNHVYFNKAIGRYVLSFGFKEWAMQAIPVLEMRCGGQARAPSKKMFSWFIDFIQLAQIFNSWFQFTDSLFFVQPVIQLCTELLITIFFVGMKLWQYYFALIRKLQKAQHGSSTWKWETFAPGCMYLVCSYLQHAYLWLRVATTELLLLARHKCCFGGTKI